MRRSIDDGASAVAPAGPDSDLTPVTWAIAITDDFDDVAPRVSLTLEEMGRPGTGLVAHLDPAVARRLRTAIGDALREIGEPV